MSKCFRYDLIGADMEYGVREHPQIDMRNLGFVVLRKEPFPISDCWIFEVDDTDANYPKVIPPYLTEIRNDWLDMEHAPKTIIGKDENTPLLNESVLRITPINKDGTLNTSKAVEIPCFVSATENEGDITTHIIERTGDKI